MGTKHLIELNGQRYDALTGKIIGNDPIPASKSTSNKLTARNLDGFSRVSKSTLAHHQVEKSKTLMRNVVPKPVVHPSTNANKKISPANTTGIFTSSSNAKHTSNISKSPLVSRFGNNSAGSQQNTSPNIAKTASTITKNATTNHIPAPNDHITNALAGATSHQLPKLKKARLSKRIASKLHLSPKIISSGSFAIAFLLLGGFFTYQNIPGLSMRLAANRSGVQGSLPGYHPAGFSLNGSIAYKPGQITVSYKSNSDNRNFKIIQDNSAWDSKALLDNYVAVNRRDFQTVQDKGKTIYMYGGNSASWVDGGIWYRIEGESSFSSDQLLHIAASL